MPADPQEAGAWLPRSWKTVSLALHLLPFAGIAFLWFIGVLRDRIGPYEDRFFATVFLGSGLLFLAMLFASSAVAGGIIMVYGAMPIRPCNALKDEAERSYFKRLPTSFSLDPNDVDKLRNAAQRLLAESGEFQRLLRDLK